MKGILKSFMIVLLSMSSAFFTAACSDDKNDSTQQNTTISTTEQGAQASSSAVNTAQTVNGTGMSFQGMVGGGTSGQHNMPKLNLPGSDSKMVKTAARISKRFAPMVKKARALHGIKKATTYGGDCQYGGTWTVEWNADNTALTFTYTDCKDGYTDYYGTEYWLTNGTYSFSVNADYTALTVTLNLTDIEYPDSSFASGQEILKDTYNNLKLTYSGEDASNADATGYNGSFTWTGTGSEDHYVDKIKAIFDVGVTMNYSYTYTQDTATYDWTWDQDMTVNGHMNFTEYDTSSGADVLSFHEKFSYSGLKTRVVWEYTAATTSYLWKYYIDNTFSIDLYPDNTCFEGTFTFETIDPISLTIIYDSAADSYDYTYSGGHVKVNGADIVYNEDGSITVTVNGVSQDYTDDELDGMCVFS